MRGVIMELSVIPQNGMIGMVQLEQVLQRPCVLLLGVLKVMRLDWRYIYGLPLTPGEELERFEGRNLKHGCVDQMVLPCCRSMVGKLNLIRDVDPRAVLRTD
jgi:hypothetical protein